LVVYFLLSNSQKPSGVLATLRWSSVKSVNISTKLGREGVL